MQTNNHQVFDYDTVLEQNPRHRPHRQDGFRSTEKHQINPFSLSSCFFTLAYQLIDLSGMPGFAIYGVCYV